MADKIELSARSGNRFYTWSLSGAMQGWFTHFQWAIGGQPFAVVSQAVARARVRLHEVRRDAEGTEPWRGGWLGPRALPIEHAPEPGTTNVTARLRLLTAIGRSLRLLKGACEASLVGMQAADLAMRPQAGTATVMRVTAAVLLAFTVLLSPPALAQSGVCGRTAQVRDALLAGVQANDDAVADCSQVTSEHLEALTGTVDLSSMSITSLEAGDFAGLTNVVTLSLSGNALTELPAGIFEELANLENLSLENNPGAASFLPTADAGADQRAEPGATVSLDGSASSGGPWGTNISYAWAVADGRGNPVTGLTLTGGDTATPSFVMPATESDGGLVFTLTVQGKGHRGLGLYKSTASAGVAFKVLGELGVTAVALASAPANGRTYRLGERIEVVVTFDEPATVNTSGGTPGIGLTVGTAAKTAGYLRSPGSRRLVFAYEVQATDRDTNGVSVPANGILLNGARIASADGEVFGLAHYAVADNRRHRVNGAATALTGGVCGRTAQVRAALLARVQSNEDAVANCSQVTTAHLEALVGTLNLNGRGIIELKSGDFANLTGLRNLHMNYNDFETLPAGIFAGLDNLQNLSLYSNNDLRTLPAGIFAGLANLEIVYLQENDFETLPAGIFEGLGMLNTLDLHGNPGAASFLPTADAGADQRAELGATVSLDGSASSGGPWGTNISYDWAVADGRGNPVTGLTLTGGDTATPSFTMPVREPDGGLVFTLTVQGKGHRGRNLYKSTDSVAVGTPLAVTSVALASAPTSGATYGNGERIEVLVTFNVPATVDASGGMPGIGLTVGTAAKTAGYLRGSGSRNLVFAYEVLASDTDTDGVSVSANSLMRNGGRIVDSDGVMFPLAHAALADNRRHKVNGAGTPLTGGVCARTAQVRAALLARVQANNDAVVDCSEVTSAHLEALTGTVALSNGGITRLKLGDFANLTNLTTVFLSGNALTGLPDGIFASLTKLEQLYLYDNDLRTLPDGVFEGLAMLRGLHLNSNNLRTLPDGVFEGLAMLRGLHLNSNPGTASFLPTADAGADQRAVSGTTVRLDGSASRGGPWGTNIGYAWAVADGHGNPVTALTVTGGDTATPSFTMPATAPDGGFVFTLTVQGKGHRGQGLYNSTDSVSVAIRAAPAVTSVALASAPTKDTTYSNGERIEVVVTFNVPATVDITDGTPSIGLTVGTAAKTAGYTRGSGRRNLVFTYEVQASDTDTDGVSVPANSLMRNGGRIGNPDGAVFGVAHDALADDAGHKVDGTGTWLTGGVCGRTPQVRDALLARVQANDDAVANCSQVTSAHLRALTGTMDLSSTGIARLKWGDFANLTNLTVLYLQDNNLQTLPDGVFEDLASLETLYLQSNDLQTLPDGVFDGLANLGTLHLRSNDLQTLPDGTFDGLASLGILYLSHNDLRTLPAGVFEDLANLWYLSLHYNDLRTLPDGIFEDLAMLRRLQLQNNPGTASFLPTADAGVDQRALSGTTVRLDGSASRGGPWGTSITYAWAVADGRGNPVTGLTVTGGDTATPSFTMPASAPEGGLVFTLTVQGKGDHSGHLYNSTDSVSMAIRAAPAVTSVALASAPTSGTTYGNGERIEVLVTFNVPATVDALGGTPGIGLTVGAAAKTAGYLRGSGSRNLVFAYEVQASDTDTDGVSVSANSLMRNGGRIVDSDGAVFGLAHDALADDASHKVNGAGTALTGGVCGRTPQVRAAVLAGVQANDDAVANCSQVTTTHLQALNAELNLTAQGIAGLKSGDFANLTNLRILYLDHNDLQTLPDGVFGGLASLQILNLSHNDLRMLFDGTFEGQPNLGTLYLENNDLQTLPNGVFEGPANLSNLYLANNPGTASFLPTADAGADQRAVSGTTVRLDGSASRGGPWGTNISYAWAVADGHGNPVTDLTVTGGDTATPSFVIPETVPDGGLVFTLSVQGKGHRGQGLYKSTDSVRVAMDVLPLVWVDTVDATVTEGTDAQFHFSRSRDSTSRLEVQVNISGHRKVMTGSATSAVVTFEAGTTETTLDLATEADTVNEGDGEISVAIRSSSEVYEIGVTGAATVLVQDDDIPEVTLRWISPTMTLQNNVWVGSMKEGQAIEFEVECTGSFRAAAQTIGWARIPLRFQELLNHPAAIRGYNEDYKRRFACAGDGDQGGYNFPYRATNKRYVGPNNGRLEVDLFPQVLSLDDIPGFNNSVYGINCYLDSRPGSPKDIRFCPKYTLGTVTSARIEVTNRNPTVIVEAIDEAIIVGQAARFRVTRIWESDVLAAYSTAFNFTITATGPYAQSVPSNSRTFAIDETEIIVEIPTVNDEVPGADGLVTFELVAGLPDVQATNIGGSYEVYDQLPGITPPGKSSRTVSVRIVDVNTAPTGAHNTMTVDEDQVYTFQASAFGFADADGDTLESVTIVSLPDAGKGTLALDGTAVTAEQVIATSDLATLTYAPPADAHLAAYASFTFKVSDGKSESALSYTMTIDVTAVNDAATGVPTISGTARVGQELTAEASAIADVDGLPALATFDWQWLLVDGGDETVIAGATASTYTLVTADADKKLKVRVSFTDLGGSDERLTSAAYPDGAPALGNTAPTGAHNTMTVDEDQVYTFQASAFGFADADGDTLESVTIVSLPDAGKGTLALDGTAVTAEQVIATSDLATLTYAPPADAHLAAYASFTFKVSDGKSESALSYTMTIDVTAVNDAATGVPTISGTARVGQELTAEASAIADVDGLPALATFDWQWLLVDGGDETVIAGATASTYTLVTADADKKLKVRVSFTDLGGSDERLTSAAYPDGAPALGNTAPTGAHNTMTVDEDQVYTFQASAFGFADADGDTLESVTIVSLPDAGKGTLALDGTAVTAEQVIATSDLATLTYAPPADAHLAAYASFTFKVSDGKSESALSYTMTIDVTAVNDAATGVPTISGTARVGQELTAEASAIADVDGLPALATFDWQWLLVDGGDETVIAGATASTYTLVTADADKKLKVRVSFTDLGGSDERLTSAAYPDGAPALGNTAPTGAHNTMTVDEDQVYTFQASAFGFADADGDTLESVTIVSLPDAGKGTLALDGTAVTAEQVIATSDLATLTYAPPADAHLAAYASFTFKVSDGKSESALSYTMTIDVTAVNDAATGVPTISGTARVGQELTAEASAIADVDGLPALATFDWQWLLVDGGDETVIAGATASTYTLVTADADKKLKVRVSFTDLGGSDERLTSAAYPDGAPGVENTAPDNTDLILDFGTSWSHTVKVLESDTVRHRFTFTLRTDVAGPTDGNPQQPVTIPLVVTHTGGATAEDYEGIPSSVTFAVGESVTDFFMRAIPDDRREPGEGLRLDFGPLPPGLRKGTWGPYETIEFVDQGLPRVTALFGAESYTAVEDGAAAQVAIHLSEPVEIEPLDVRLQLRYGGGATDADHGPIPMVVTIPVGERTWSFPVAATDDTDDDDGESVTLSFVEDPNDRVVTGVGPGRTTVALEDNDGVARVEVSFGAATYAATERGDAATVEVRLDAAPGRSVTVPLTAAGDGGATPADYSAIPANVAFGPNETSKTFTVTAEDDPESDGGESVRIGFGALPQGVLAGRPAAAVVTLKDGTEQTFVVSFGTHPTFRVQAREGNVGKRIGVYLGKDRWGSALNAEPRRPVTIPLVVTYLGTATEADHTAIPASVTFEVGKGTAGFSVRAIPDGEAETGEGLRIDFGSLPPGVTKGRWGYETIEFVDEEPPPATLSVADAEVQEGSGAVLAFTVTLSRALTETVTVEYNTEDGTASAGADYTDTSGTLTFTPGQTSQTVSVPVLEDSHDEGSETLTLRLRNPAPTHVRLADAQATGTVNNTDAMPQAWLARFGRAGSDHVIEAVSERWQDGPRASQLTVGGRRAGDLFGWTGLGERDATDKQDEAVASDAFPTQPPALSGAAGSTLDRTAPGMSVNPIDMNAAPAGPGGVDGEAGATLGGRAAQSALLRALGLPEPGALTDLRALLMGSSFFYSGTLDEDGRARKPGWLGEWSAWGRTAASRFSGAEGELSLDGEVATAMLGFDSRWDRWLAGLVVSYSEGQGAYTHPTAAGGAVASTMTGLHPYARYELNERTSLWGVLGYGVGELSLTPERSATALGTDLTNAMAAFGGRTALSVHTGRAGRFELAIRSDARLTNTASEAIEGLAGAARQTGRVRLMLEGSGSMPLATGGMLKPKLEAGLRYDAGDAETGAGLEVSGGLGYAAGQLSVEVKARGLLAHRDTEYVEWGFSGSIAYTPSEDGRGLSMKLGSAWGVTQSGVQSLWSRQDASGLARNAAFDAAQRYQVELRYGLDGLQGRALWAPYIGVESGDGSSRALRLGVALTSGRGLDVGLDLARRQGRAGADPEQAVQLRGALRW